MFVAERFLSNVVNEYGQHPVSTDGGTWYPQACQFLKLNHHIHSSHEKSIIDAKEKDRTECFDVIHVERKMQIEACTKMVKSICISP